MFDVNTAEKIETIVQCYLQNGTKSGTFGSMTEFGWKRYRVVADDRTVIVWRDKPRELDGAYTWHVLFKHNHGIDAELYFAAQLAFDN
jgi:hypothetical protein